MSTKYKAGLISATTEATEVVVSFDGAVISIFPVENNIQFRIMNRFGWGDWITVPKNVAFNDHFIFTRIQVKSTEGTATVHYFVAG